MDSISPREHSPDNAASESRQLFRDSHNLPPLAGASTPRVPEVPQPSTSPRSSEPTSMPLTTEFMHSDASSTDYHLPSAVEDRVPEPQTSRPSASAPTRDVSKRLGLVQLGSDAPSHASQAVLETVSSPRLHSATDTEANESRETPPARFESSSGGPAAIPHATGGSEQQQPRSVSANVGGWCSPSNTTSQSNDTPSTSGETGRHADADALSPQSPPPQSNGASSPPLPQSIASIAALHKRTSYIGARAHKKSNASETGFKFGLKHPNLSAAGSGNPSYSRSLRQFLTSGTGATSPRIYPVAYAPGECQEGDERVDSTETPTHRSRGSFASLRYVSHRSGASRRSASRNEPSAAQMPFAPQTVQIAAATDVPVAAASTHHRAAFAHAQKTVAEIFGQPQEAIWVKALNRAMFVLIVLNFAVMALETCDGKNFAGSDPGYPYLPTEQTYRAVDAVLSVIFSLELFGRVAAQRFAKAILFDPFTIADFVALLPWYGQLVLNAAGVAFNLDAMSGKAHSFALFRLVRAVRLGNVLRQHDQTRILYLSIRASLRPLGITMFFLFTLIMLLATALFYAEPCYNVRTCQFTDIFNAAYFIMVTVATVGYGNQVPSLDNWPSVFVTGVAMICGQMYFAMPVFIIGNNFQSTYENFQWNSKRKLRQLDDTLSPFDAQELHAHVAQLTTTQFHLLDAWRVVQLNIQKMVRKSKAPDAGTKDGVAAQKQRLAKINDVAAKLLNVHSEACQLLQVFVPHKKKQATASSDTAQDSVFAHIYVRARRAMARAKTRENAASLGSRDASAMAQTMRGRLWLLLEVPDSSQLARVINRIMVCFAILSIFVFCCESLPELSSTGVSTAACRRVVHDYCKKTGFDGTSWSGPDPGCYVRDASGAADFAKRIDFTCASADTARECYGSGWNFGSLNPAMPSCADVFDATGVSLICYRQQCNDIATIVDMGPYWIYIEWMFGLAFTLELVLRFVASQERARLLRDFYIAFDILSVVPFFVEVIQYVVQGVEPSYAIVATSPSFLSVIRVMKTMRILKLTRHFKGTKVLASTAKSVWKQLTIPIFFLFTGCIIAGACFYEIERGTECYVGRECMWWDKNVLTPKFANGLPLGKRILIQDRRKSTITDMIRSTWLSYTTLTAVGYGDLVPRTSIGKVFCICVVIISTIYSAMPVSLVGSKFYELYEKHMEKMVVKRGGSSTSWNVTKRNLKQLASAAGQPGNTMSSRSIELFALSEADLEVLHQFVSMKRTLTNLQRNLDNFSSVGIDILQQHKSSSAGEAPTPPLAVRKTDNLEQSIEQKSNAIMDTLLQFSLVIEKLQDAPPTYEALVDDPLQSLVVTKAFAALKR